MMMAFLVLLSIWGDQFVVFDVMSDRDEDCDE